MYFNRQNLEDHYIRNHNEVEVQTYLCRFTNSVSSTNADQSWCIIPGCQKHVYITCIHFLLFVHMEADNFNSFLLSQNVYAFLWHPLYLWNKTTNIVITTRDMCIFEIGDNAVIGCNEQLDLYFHCFSAKVIVQ